MRAKLKRLLKRVAALAALLAVVFMVLAATGVLDGWMQAGIVGRIEDATGGKVQLKTFRFQWTALKAELGGLTVRGNEPEDTPPLFQAERIVADVSVVSLFSRKIALDEILVERPAVQVRFDKEGKSNYPGPKAAGRAGGKPWQQRLLDLAIGKLRWNEGELLVNDVRVPLAVEGDALRLALDGEGSTAGTTAYRGELSWKGMTIAARRYRPFASDLELKFRLEGESASVEALRWKLPNSELKASAEISKTTPLEAEFKFGGTVSLEDVRTILRKPNSPAGTVEFSMEGKNAGGKTEMRGRYAARDIELPYTWFHTGGISTWGELRVAERRLRVPKFEARALGGTLAGNLEMDFAGPAFRVTSEARGMNLAALLAAVDHEAFPIGALHWKGRVDVDARTNWTADFQHVESEGHSVWTAASAAEGTGVPAAARINFEYSMDQRAVMLRQSEITTPASRLAMDGRLGSQGSLLAVRLDAEDLLPWNDFINALRGVRAGSETVPKRIAGRAKFDGRVSGPLEGPEFAGHVRGWRAEYGRMAWDEIEGDISYSPRQFRMDKTRATLGKSSAGLALWLELDGWSFRPESQWSMEARLERAETDDLQELFEWSYPARGLLTGEFRGGGTRKEPHFGGLFDVVEGAAYGWRVERARGQFTVASDIVRVVHAEVRMPAGRITGNFLHRRDSGEVEFDATGAGLAVERLERVQMERLPLGGELSFQVRGSGPAAAPVSEGWLRLLNLRTGKDVLGRLDGRLRSDGRRMRIELESQMSDGKISGGLDLTLGGGYPIAGNLEIAGVDLDAVLETVLRMGSLTGHSRVDGKFRISGEAARPESLAIEADISKLAVNYRFLQLENEGPLRVAYRNEEIRVENAHIRGPVTDVRISGFARTARDQQLGLQLAGKVNLQLLGGIWPELEARGAAEVSTAIEGTLTAPRVTGRIRVENAAANYGEFPAGLSEVSGEFVFDRSRLLFENVRATAGGGELLLTGTMSYGAGPLRYDISGQATRVRLRYPEGMGWLAGGRLQFAGTTQAAMLSGKITVERVLLAPGFDFTSMLGGSGGEVRAPAATSPFVRNLQFDIEAASSPDARLEWSGARFESEASLRVRGTWEHPIILGHIHLLGGEMNFRGNRYRLTRGDVHFANPLRPDPLLNLEATTTVRQYDITLNLAGQSSKLNLAYRSDPPLPSGDILALLALGRTGEESELRTPLPGQSTELGANTLLSEAISSQLGGRIERLFGVSRFKVDPFLAGTGTEQNASARITIEQQVTRDLVVTYVTNVTSTQYQVIQFEYTVSRDLSLVALRDQNGTFGVDFKWKKRFR